MFDKCIQDQIEKFSFIPGKSVFIHHSNDTQMLGENTAEISYL